MQIKLIKVAFATLAVTILSGAFGLNLAHADSDNGWKGPGWYQVFYSTGVYLIYSGPYATQAAFYDYVQPRLDDDDYMKGMGAKYGKYGDGDDDWEFECRPLNAATDLPD